MLVSFFEWIPTRKAYVGWSTKILLKIGKLVVWMTVWVYLLAHRPEFAETTPVLPESKWTSSPLRSLSPASWYGRKGEKRLEYAQSGLERGTEVESAFTGCKGRERKVDQGEWQCVVYNEVFSCGE
jgi:hypothetical protein